MGEIIKGKPVGDALSDQLKLECEALVKDGIQPKLAILRVGAKPNDLSYEKGALKKCETIGIQTEVTELPEGTTQDEYIAALEKLNNDASVNGILTFRPLPEGIDEEVIKNVIAAEKDVDCFSPLNTAKLMEGDKSGFPPCTPTAVVEILKELEQKYALAEKEKENLKDRNKSLWYFTISLTIALTASIVALYFSWIHRKLKVKNAHLSEEIAKTQWGFALSKELIADNSSAYEKLELLLTKNIKLIPNKVYYEFENSLKAQKEEYSQRLFSALTNIDNNFIEKLQRKFPELNIDEVMLAYMLRHEWDINDIAQVFRISFEAFKKRKYRLKVKILGTDNNKISLEDYLNKM